MSCVVVLNKFPVENVFTELFHNDCSLMSLSPELKIANAGISDFEDTV